MGMPLENLTSTKVTGNLLKEHNICMCSKLPYLLASLTSYRVFDSNGGEDQLSVLLCCIELHLF